MCTCVPNDSLLQGKIQDADNLMVLVTFDCDIKNKNTESVFENHLKKNCILDTQFHQNFSISLDK